MNTIIRLSCIFLAFYKCNGQIMHSTIVFSPSELVSDKITNNTGFDKLALRYGIHQTAECDNYEKAFLCIQKCVDKGYDVAYSDKYCFCTCYVKSQKAKYRMEHQFDRTKWKLGMPKTTKPAWIQKLENNAQKITAESVDIIKKLETQKKDDNYDISDVSNETETVNEHNATISDDATTPSDSENMNVDTNGTDNNLLEYKATNGSLTDSNATKVSESQKASNVTDIENEDRTADSTDSLNTTIATNTNGSIEEHEDTTISDIKNESIAQNASKRVFKSHSYN